MTVEAATSLTKSTTALALKACESATGTGASRSITIRAAFGAQGTGNPLQGVHRVCARSLAHPSRYRRWPCFDFPAPVRPMKAPAPASQFRAGKPQHGARRVVIDQFTTLPLCRQFGSSTTSPLLSPIFSLANLNGSPLVAEHCSAWWSTKLI
jgi:hypothetical protein